MFDLIALGQQVRSHHRQKRRKSVLLVRESAHERRFGRAAARSQYEIDVSDFVAITDERFTDAESLHYCHRHLPSKELSNSYAPHRRFPACDTTPILVDSARLGAGPVSQIAAEHDPATSKSTTVARRRQDGSFGFKTARKQGRDGQIGTGAGIDAFFLKRGVPREEFR